MALPVLPLAAGAAVLVLLMSKKAAAAKTDAPYSQAPADGSKPPVVEPKPPAKTWKEMPQALQEQVAAALGALGVSPATGELGPDPVGADAIKLATQTAALCESQGFYDVAKELNRLAGLAAKKVPTPKEAGPIKAAAPPGLTPAQIEAIARTLTLDRDPKSIQALLEMLMKLPPSPQRDNFIGMAQALLLQLAAAQSTTQTMQQIDQVIKSPGWTEVQQAVQPLPPAVIPVVTPSPVTTPVLPAPALPAPAASADRAALARLTGTRVLQSGSTGNDVKAWQQILRLDGFSPSIDADGVFGAKTITATKLWQSQRGLTADGKVGKDTRAKIGSSPIQDKPVAIPTPVSTPALPTTHLGLAPLTGSRLLQAGLSGNDVKAWQAILRLDGFAPSIDADGVFGAKTTTATKLWQAQRGLTADGKVGPGTRAKIGSPPVATKAPAAAPTVRPVVTAPAQPKPAPSGLTLDKFPDPSPNARTLQKGSKGADVESWQRILIAMGYPMGNFGPNKDGVDGDFGATADKQTRAFQAWAQARYKDPRITVDGKVGPITRRLVLMRTAEAKAAQVAGRYAA